jgi:hypothetical protein
MRKKIFWALGLFFLAFFVEKKSCAQITVDQRYSTQTRFYSRIFFEKNLVKEFGMIAGYNVDGRGIAHLQASYEVFDGIKFLVGFGYHHFQDGVHPALGIAIKKEIFDVEIAGHCNIYFNHLYHIGSEIEILKRISKNIHVGLIGEAEIGKEFMPLKEAEEFYIPKTPEYETVVVIGPKGQTRLSSRLLLTAFVAFGIQNKKSIAHFASTSSVGISYNFSSHH